MEIHINHLAVVVAAAVGYGLGALWFSPLVFGGKWVELMGKKPEELGNPTRALLITAVTTLLTAYVLAWLLALAGADTWLSGLKVALVVGLGIHCLTAISDAQFAGKPAALLAIDTGHRLTMFVLMGLVIGAMS